MRLRRLAFASLGALALALPATAETLTDALIGAYRTSGLLEQQRAVLRAADEDVASAAARLRPALDYAAQLRWQDPVAPGADRASGSAAIDASVLLYDFGATPLGVEARKEAVLAARAALTSAEQSVLLRAVQAYMNVLRAEAFVDLTRNNVRLIREQLRAARDRFEVGEVTRTDVSLAEARLAAAEAGAAAEEGNLAAAREEYNAAVGRMPGRLTAVGRVPALPPNEAAAKARAVETHPDILEQQLNVKVAELGIVIAERGLLPTLRAGATVAIDDEWDDSTSLSLTFGGPIYQGGALASAVRRAKAQRDAARGGLISVTRAVVQAVGSDWATLRVAIARQEAANREVQAASLALEGLREELQLGARTTLEVLDQEQELLDARTNRVSAEIDRIVAAFDILESVGLLTVEALNLPVPSYDPAAYSAATAGAPVVDVSPQGERLDHILRRLGRQ